MMARTAEWRDDISGTITTAGTSTAYTLSSNQGFDTLAHMNNALIAFVPNVTNGATVTLNVDSLGAKPLRSAPSTELASGVIIQGSPYTCTYNNSDGAFYLSNFFVSPNAVPLGSMIPYIGASAPSTSFALPYGQQINRTTYSALFSLVGTTYGVGDGATTFNIPDLRGRTIFGIDNMGGSAAGFITAAGGNWDGRILGQAGGSQNRTLTQAQLPALALAFSGNAIPNVAQSAALSGQNGNTVNVPGSYVSVTPSGNVTANGSTTLGSGSSIPTLPPAMSLSYILRII